MNQDFELKGLYRRLEHLQKFSTRASYGALLVGFICALFFFNFGLISPQRASDIAWRSSGVIWLVVGCYFLGVATSYLFVRKLKRIVKSNKEKWHQDEVVQESC
ncbi:MAG: hypothetical protein F4W92_09340 [Gammaproteobacteria bacterium]|nr:hypothetical protein [Gammaproteobacteria bacterium]